MDTVDWRAQLPPGSRQIQVNEIISKLSFYSPTVDEDMSVEVRKIAQSLENKIYADAASEVDYMHKISMKIQLILGYSWRAQLTLDSRQRIANKILETLRRPLPVFGPEGLYQLREIAERFEEKIYTTATSQSDYLRKISTKMLAMEIKRPNPVNNSVTLNPSGDVTNGNELAKESIVAPELAKEAADDQREKPRQKRKIRAPLWTKDYHMK